MFEKFCDDPFWDPQLSWNASSPQLTKCFRDTALVWVPAAYLILVLPFEIGTIIKTKKYIKWNFYNIIRQILSSILIIASVSECIVNVIRRIQQKQVTDANIVGSFIRLSTSIILFVLFLLYRYRGIHTSGMIWYYLLLEVMRGAPTLHAFIHGEQRPSEYELTLFCSHYLIIILIFFILCFGDFPPQKIQKGDDSEHYCPKENASYLSRITYWWFNAMAILGWRKPLTTNDLWKIRDGDKCDAIIAVFSKHWNAMMGFKEENNKLLSPNGVHRQMSNGSEKNNFNEMGYVMQKQMSVQSNKSVNRRTSKKKPGIVRGIIKTFWWYFLSGAVFKLGNDLTIFLSPQILKLLIQFVKGKDEEPLWHGYFYAVLLFITTIIQLLSLNYYFHRMLVIGMRIRACLVSAIYRKALRIGSSARNQSTTGEIVNLMAVDAQRFMELTSFINMLWSAPLQIALSLYFLYQELGDAVFGGVAIMIIMIPVNAYLTAVSKKLQIKQMKLKDERVKAMNEVLNGIKVLKLYGWEKAFMENILAIRKRELNRLKIMNYFGCILQCIWFCAPFFVAFATFAIYVLIDPEKNVLDAQKAFVSLSLFNILRFPMSLLPNLITTLIMTSVSVKRINKFLNGNELSDYVIKDIDRSNAIEIESASFSWESPDDDNPNSLAPTLHNIDLKIAKGSFVAIVGSVGSGKSSLLSAILGHMEKTEGNVMISKSMRIAYVPQQAWIQNCSLKNNILFGKSFRKEVYDTVIYSCALGPDLEILAGGDETEIGEKGINLSGGQKQRVSVARACYNDADLYLFDDPLSAVDSHVGKHMFDEVLNSKTGILKNKTRILVTNSLSILPDTDKVIVLKDGRISEMGTYNELISRKQYFSELIQQYTTKDNENTTEESENNEKAKNVKTPNEGKSKLVEEEKAETGEVKYTVYLRYFSSISAFWCVLIIVNYILMQVSSAGSSVWLAAWSNDNSTGNREEDYDQMIFRLVYYGVIGFSQTIFVTFGWYALTRGIIKAANHLHYQMLDRILHSPMSFFDTTPLGRILNRFSKDIDTVDSVLQMTIRVWLVCCFQTIATFIVISIEVPIFLVLIVPISIMYFFIQKFYVVTSRQLKRLESITRSPIYSHFSETLSGAATINAYDANQRFIKESDDRVDQNQICYYPNIAANRWLSVRLELIANCIVLFSAIFSVIYRESLLAGTVGLIVSYSLNVTQNLNWLVRMTSEIETNIVGVERILEYSDLNTEAEWHIESTAPNKDWPNNGHVEFVNYETKYREGLDLVLRGINAKIERGEKIGIVGRTGAGKSSLTLALFRLIEPTNGKIIIDDINISEIGLYQLRSRLTIIPQDPVLFSGTVRSNLDPFNVYNDDQLWKALELAHLKSFVKGLDSTLDHRVAEGGDNLSVGQRQLICLARALLRNTKVLILDEATAAVDLETDSLIQQTIREAFSHCTVLTIAHRLHTIMDSNRVMVLSDGKIAEFDSPNNLLNDKKSIFHSLAKDAGIIKK